MTLAQTPRRPNPGNSLPPHIRDQRRAIVQHMLYSRYPFAAQTLEISMVLSLDKKEVRKLLLGMQDDGLIHQERVGKRWKANVETDQSPTVATEQGPGLTARYSPPGVRKAGHSLHHRKR